MQHLFTDENPWLKSAVKTLSLGGLVIYPTETSYGLGADATNPQAIDKLLAYKGNRLNKALSVAVADFSMAQKYIHFNPTASKIFQTLLPGPITLVAKSTGLIAPKVESERHTLGIRYSSHPIASQLVAAFGKPITATSANTSGTKQIYSFQDFHQYVPQSRQPLIDLFIDAKKLPVRPPSTIVDTTLDNPEILRQGEITFDQAVTINESTSTNETISIAANLLEKHLDLLTTKTIVFALEGDLGAGKTHFAKGIAQALGITQTVASPTYTIMHEYPYVTDKISGTLYHIDTWRLFENESLDSLGLRDRLRPGDVVVIEWQQKANDWIKTLNAVTAKAWVKIETISETNRKILVKWT